MRSIPRRHLLLGAAVGGTALAAGTVTPAVAAPPHASDLDKQARDLLLRMRVPRGPATADGPVWSPYATGFAGVPAEGLTHGAVGGLGGEIVTVRTVDALAEAIARPAPTAVLVEGTSAAAPFGTNLPVSRDTTIAGVGCSARRGDRRARRPARARPDRRAPEPHEPRLLRSRGLGREERRQRQRRRPCGHLRSRVDRSLRVCAPRGRSGRHPQGLHRSDG